MHEWLVAYVAPFLSPVDLVHILTTCRRLLLAAFDPAANSSGSNFSPHFLLELSRHLLLSLVADREMTLSLENSSILLLRGLSGLSTNQVRKLSFTSHKQGLAIDVSMDSFPTTAPISDTLPLGVWAGNHSVVPFTSLEINVSGAHSLRLSAVKYFEVSYLYTTTSDANRGHMSFGLTAACPIGENCFQYQCRGRVLHNRTVVLQGPLHRFRTGDIVGCGIVYPPADQGHGAVFFTRNGELLHLWDLPEGGTHQPWHAFAVHDSQTRAQMHWGNHQAFAFDVRAFERSLLFSHPDASPAGTSWLSQEDRLLWGATARSKTQCVACCRSAARKLLFFVGHERYCDDNGATCVASLLVKIVRDTYASTAHVDGGQVEGEIEPQQSAAPTWAMPQSAVPAWPLRVPTDPRRVRSEVSFARSAGGGEEDGMTVELSSVESQALRGMRRCNISAGPQCVRLSSPAPPNGADAAADSDADGSGVSDASEVATSLCVEVNSLDEDGSYLGYGGGCHEEEEDYERGDRVRRQQPADADSDGSTRPSRQRQSPRFPLNGDRSSPGAVPDTHKRKRDDEPTARSQSCKRGVLTASVSSLGDGSADTASCTYVVRPSSPSLRPIDRADFEDGYDGASECGEQLEGTNIPEYPAVVELSGSPWSPFRGGARGGRDLEGDDDEVESAQAQCLPRRSRRSRRRPDQV